MCDNCLDDDGDGTVDLEDDDCCATTAALAVEGLRLHSIGTLTEIALDASALPPLASVVPMTSTLRLQLAADGGPPTLCAVVHAAHFRSRGNRARFTDRTMGVPGAAGIETIRLTRLGTGALRMKLRGPRARFPFPGDATHARVVVALRSLVAPGTPIRCTARTVDLDPSPAGGLAFP